MLSYFLFPILIIVFNDGLITKSMIVLYCVYINITCTIQICRIVWQYSSILSFSIIIFSYKCYYYN